MKIAVKKLKQRLEKTSTRQGLGTIEYLSNPHLRRWFMNHVDRIDCRHIMYLAAVESIDELINNSTIYKG